MPQMRRLAHPLLAVSSHACRTTSRPWPWLPNGACGEMGSRVALNLRLWLHCSCEHVQHGPPDPRLADLRAGRM
eukprot:3739856-Pyramimonas_sp.AAC.1